ncbi:MULTISPECIES: type I methionyl aminopeptidase [Convivina]|uniref:Methionine aminopeptidase n=2 Tax=Convivina TaxID=1697027 RepID=A0A2U1DFP2_9LACO|nr:MULTISPECIES: type I methionyl aminopeptidase [Convivina]SDB84131.1 methionyl aminopeptidase [Leuconostocaceae bacterium R-53105]PVY86488.1 methionine aminopeptidase type I [Convivina intestini]CAH1850040.1 Methionine aminopeptidase 1 [Convivina intestini]CAH1853387.1 Methionine aminopeptidase 1 [Convivina sp. LMG 32447]CAH1854757.1 Methionine aminopeptidase 1 [Convivina sp. LMG 32447]
MISLKSPREIEAMRKSGAVLAGMHHMVRDLVKPGIDTWEIETRCREYIESHGAVPLQIGFEGFKYATTISINDEVAHGLPRKGLKLKNGDLLKVDTVVGLDGAVSDSAWSYAVGEVSPEVQQLMDVAKKSLYLGIDQAVIGNRIGDIGWAIQDYTENQHHYGDVRQYIGHGVGPTMHEDPQVPHYGKPGHGVRLQEGLVITIEPMINMGGWEVITDDTPEDGWTVRTADGSWSAQYEHTLAITKDGPKILTSQDPEFDAPYL